MGKYSQAGQDEFVLSQFDEGYIGTFIDIGCRLPYEINNTLMLEEKGWYGVSMDILDFSKEWETRKTPFFIADALNYEYDKLVEDYNLIKIIDYLSLDIEGVGLRYQALKKIIEYGYEFKVITIEHDIYRGLELSEREPQRKLLNQLNYVLVCSNVSLSGNPFEDWWINPKYITEDKYLRLISDNLSSDEILKKI